MNWIKNSVLLIVSILFCLIVLEIGARWLDLGYGFSPLLGDPVVHHKHPENDFFVGYHPHGVWDSVSVHYDRFGNRYDGETTIEAPDGVILGDSFVEGTMVEYGATIPAAFDGFGLRVWNLGVSSYSPILSYLQLKRSSDNLKSSKFALHLLYLNDIDGDPYFEEHATFVDGNVVAVPGNTNRLSDILRNVHFFRLLRRIQLTLMFRFGMTDDNWRINPTDPAPINATNKKYLAKIQRFVEGLGARYFLSCVPPKDADGQAAMEEGIFCQSVREFARKSGITYIDLPRAFSGQKLFFPEDIHFDSAGSRRVSEFVTNQVVQSLAAR